MYYAMEMDEQLKAYYNYDNSKRYKFIILIVLYTQILIKTTVELSTHLYMTMLINWINEISNGLVLKY